MPDPVWLADVIREVGLTCDIFPGAFDRGHGDMPGTQWGTMWHHTGAPAGSTPGPRAIAQHPTLGLASQLYLARDGRWTLCGVGIAYHAGRGSYTGLPTNNANPYVIGIEAENSGTEGWSAAQYGAYVLGTAAIHRRLGVGANRMIGHREWSSEGKWDPGGLDLGIARAHIADALAELGAGRRVPAINRYRVNSRTINAIDTGGGAMTDRQLLQEIWGQLRGPGGKGWAQLGNRTPVDALADVIARLDRIERLLTEQRIGE